MTRNGLPIIHPGEMLRDEIEELGLSAAAFARALSVPTNRITQILKGQRAISAETSLRFARYFSCSEEFWLNLQTNYDLRTTEKAEGKRITREVQPKPIADAA